MTERSNGPHALLDDAERHGMSTDRPGAVGDLAAVVPDVLAVLRLAFAGAAWAISDHAGRFAGLTPASPSHRYLLRAFAGREAALGLGVLLARGPARRRWQQLALLVDVSDTAAGFDRRLGTRGRALGLATTGTYTVLDALILARMTTRERR